MIDDLHRIAKRITRMRDDGETNNEVFARDAGTLADLVLSIEKLTTKRFK
jgi:hypothetical protein